MKLKFFASLRDEINCDEEQFELPLEIQTIAQLKQHLQQRSTVWEQAFSEDKTIISAVNHESADLDTPITNQDEVAFFPPVTGG